MRERATVEICVNGYKTKYIAVWCDDWESDDAIIQQAMRELNRQIQNTLPNVYCNCKVIKRELDAPAFTGCSLGDLS